MKEIEQRIKRNDSLGFLSFFGVWTSFTLVTMYLELLGRSYGLLIWIIGWILSIAISFPFLIKSRKLQIEKYSRMKEELGDEVVIRTENLNRAQLETIYKIVKDEI